MTVRYQNNQTYSLKRRKIVFLTGLLVMRPLYNCTKLYIKENMHQILTARWKKIALHHWVTKLIPCSVDKFWGWPSITWEGKKIESKFFWHIGIKNITCSRIINVLYTQNGMIYAIKSNFGRPISLEVVLNLTPSSNIRIPDSGCVICLTIEAKISVFKRG